MGCILAMILVKRLSKNENNKFVYLEWISDNISAIDWASKNKCNSQSGQKSFMAFTWLQIISHVMIVKTSHLPGIYMDDVDSLSRRKPLKFLKEEKRILTDDDRQINKLFTYLNPTVIGNLCEHHAILSKIHSIFVDEAA
jgi:hypothetical protein